MLAIIKAWTRVVFSLLYKDVFRLIKLTPIASEVNRQCVLPPPTPPPPPQHHSFQRACNNTVVASYDSFTCYIVIIIIIIMIIIMIIMIIIIIIIIIIIKLQQYSVLLKRCSIIEGNLNYLQCFYKSIICHARKVS